jgi:hypothetical protein
MDQETNLGQLIEFLTKRNSYLKNKLDEILKEHSRPHESEDVYAANMSLLLQDISKELKNK